MILLENTNQSDEVYSPNLALIYCALVVITATVAAVVRSEIHDTQSVSYANNFAKFRDAVACIAMQHQNNQQHGIHKINEDVHSKTFQKDKEKIEFLHNTVNALSIDDTMELKQNFRKMKLPIMCRAYIIRELNKHRRQCIRG